MKGFKKLMKWVKPYWGLLILIIASVIINPFAYSYVPQFTKYVVDTVFGGKDSIAGGNTLPPFLLEFFDSFLDQKILCLVIIGLSLVIFQALRGGLMVLGGYAKGKFSENMAFDMREKLYTHIQDLPYSYHNNADTGDLIQRCTSDIDTIKGFLGNQISQLVYIFASFGFGAWQMALIEPRIMLVTLCVIPITIIMSIVYFGYVKKKFTEIEEVESDMTVALQENVNGVRVVKAFAKEKYEIDKFDKKSQRFRDKSRKLNDSMAIYWGLSDFLTISQYVITVGVCIYLARKGLVTSGDVIACFLYINMLVYPVRGLGRIIGDFGKATVSAGRVDEVLSIEDDYKIDGTLKPEITGNISFKDVSFKFNDTEDHLLEQVNFSINSGETVAIIGKTGSGKSTIANILVRLQDYDEGSVTIDGVELKEISKKWIRSKVGIILQDPFLYAKTIFDNIKIGQPALSTNDVYKAAQTAAIHKDIVSFEKGYDTLVGEKGVTLSGGQKQRIAIARMLVLNKPIMIFDDSLSAVDTKTDLMIRNALKERDTSLTTIIITHRITTAKEADKIIVLENGHITDIGTHETLSKKEGLYKSLWSIQGDLEDEFLKTVKGGAK